MDKHLIAYLGYLVGKNANIQTEYVIISSDKGYDKVCEFLRDECGNSISVSRRSTIDLEKVTQKIEVQQKAEKKTSVSKMDPAKKTNKTLLYNKIQQILSKANVGKEDIDYVPGLVIKHCDEKNALQTIYRAIIQKFGQKKGLYIYNRIKKHI